MKKLLMVISVLCMGTFGIGSTAFAGVDVTPPPAPMDFLCSSTTDEFCDGSDRWEVTIICMNFTPTQNSGVDFDGTDWSIWVVENGGDLKCDAAGAATLLKTEVKCTDASKGSNKKPKHGTGSDQVNVEIKSIPNDGFCPV